MKRTNNTLIIVVTLDVSKLSGWLKADAPCRGEEGRTMRGEVQPGRYQGGGTGRGAEACTGTARK